MSFQSFIKTKPEVEYQRLVRSVPTQASIYLPTDKLSIEQKIIGLKKVRNIYEGKLDNYYRPKLKDLRQKYQHHRRCFLIGNGPSLNQTDLSLLKNEITFAVNSFFLKFDEIDWRPTFYVVEDHLVAEDREFWLNQLENTTKLFPVYLAYCLSESSNTIFFNHQPRVSFPHAFDFSTNAADVTYTGCTVIFTCMQLAYYMGFREIYLVGVDANYELPEDVAKDDSYGTCILDMKSNDPNHFHPDYFGKGFRWHDPQVNKMIEAYEVARLVCNKSYQQIKNATLGGKLEVFERTSFSSLFSEKYNMKQVIEYPKLLMIDSTPVGQLSATGQLKKTFLENWPVTDFLQFWTIGGIHPSIFATDLHKTVDDSRKSKIEMDVAIEMAIKFDPEVLYFRPVDSPLLFELIERIIIVMPRPLVIHIMDDWMERMRLSDFGNFQKFDKRLRKIIDFATVHLSISDDMSAVFAKRYGKQWHSLANGVDNSEFVPHDWKARPNFSKINPLRIRYMGGLADDMSFESVRDIAKAVDLLQEKYPVIFEIRTMEWYLKKAQSALGQFRGVNVDHLVAQEDYIPFLCESDVLAIAYNFDDKSMAYTSLSLANKMPECLASGAVVMAYGPENASTIRYLKNAKCAIVIEKRGFEYIFTELERLILDVGLCDEISQRGTEWVSKYLSKSIVQHKFRSHHLKAKELYVPESIFNTDLTPIISKRNNIVYKIWFRIKNKINYIYIKIMCYIKNLFS